MRKYIVFLIFTFIVGCDEKLIYSRSKSDEVINKFCLTPEPNVSLDINRGGSGNLNNTYK